MSFKLREEKSKAIKKGEGEWTLGRINGLEAPVGSKDYWVWETIESDLAR